MVSGPDHSRFIAYAKANPGKINVATVSGTTLYMAGALFMMMTSVDMLQVPYRGAAAAADRSPRR